MARSPNVQALVDEEMQYQYIVQTIEQAYHHWRAIESKFQRERDRSTDYEP